MSDKIEKESLFKVVDKLIGEIRPMGDTIDNEEYFENLKTVGCLIEHLLGKLSDTNLHCKYSPREIDKRSYDYVVEFFKDIEFVKTCFD